MAASAVLVKARASRLTCSPRSAEFLKHYLGGAPGVRFNGLRTVLACGWTQNTKSAGVLATQELKKLSVQQAIARHVEAEHTTVEKVIARTALRAYATVKDVLAYDAEGHVTLIPTESLSDAGAALVGGVKQRRSVRTDTNGETSETIELEVKLWDGDAARRDLLKLHGLLKESVHVEGEILHVHLSAAAEDLRTQLLGGPRHVSAQRGPALPPASTNGAGRDAGHALNGGSSGAAL